MRAIESFLRLIWPDAGEKVIAAIKGGKIQQHWFKDIPSAADKAMELTRAGVDVYMGVSSFDTQDRHATHSLALKTLFLDLDCGEGKDYPDQATARAALDTFVAATQLPIPFVLSSGFGLHVYWPLDEPLEREPWLALALGLKALCKTYAFKADEACTADAARILRPIGTYNYKNGQPRRVEMVAAGSIYTAQDLRTRLLDHQPGVFETLARQQVEAATVKTTQFNETPPIIFDDILPRCATLRWAYENQHEVREPLWYAALGVADYCEAPVETAHRLSSQHPGYDRDNTERKQSQWRSSTTGPPTCDYFRKCPGSVCHSCTERVASPVLLGRPRNAIPPTVQYAQHNGSNRFRFADGNVRVNGHGLQVLQQIKDTPATWIKIAEHGVQPLLELRLIEKDGTTANYVWMETHDQHDAIQTHFLVPAATINNSDRFATECAKHGLINEQEVSPAAFRVFTKTMRNWVRKLEEQQQSIVTFDSFGWMGPENAPKDSFLLGNKLYTRTGIQTIPILPQLKDYQTAMVAKGTLEAWTAAMDQYNLAGMEPYMFTSWAAWGAPLMKFTSSGNIVVSLIGDTGAGKSSLQRAIASVYGDWNSNILVDQHDSTINSVNANLGCLNSLPYIREEASENQNLEEIVSWVLTMTQGRDRGRLNQTLNKVPVKTWSTIAILSSNTSIREIVVNTRKDNAARLARTWEIDMSLPIDSALALKLFRPLRENYGHAGPIYAQYMVENQDDLAMTVRTAEDNLMRKFNALGHDRFHISFLAACLIGAQVAIKLGLIHHDYERGKRYAFKQYQLLHKSAQDEALSVEQILAQMIHELQPTTLVVEYDMPATATTVFDSNNNVVRAPSNHVSIDARYAIDSHAFYVSSLVLRKWYVDNHLNFRAAMDELGRKGILTSSQAKTVLTKGTRLTDRRQTRCSVFNLSGCSELVDTTAKLSKGKP